MKNLLFGFLILAFGKSFGQTFPDVIIDSIDEKVNCEITMINDNNFFYKWKVSKSQILVSSIEIEKIKYWLIKIKDEKTYIIRRK